MSEINRPNFAERREQFGEAIACLPWVAERIAAGQQFNAYEHASNDEDDDPEDAEYSICVGPISDARFLCSVVGRERAKLIEAALKVATEAIRERYPQSARGESEGFSVEGRF